MTSSRPYLIRAIYDWVVDNGLTPYLLVDAEGGSVVVPTQHVQQGRIVLNVAPRAVSALDLGNDTIAFRARFSGADMAIQFPVDAVLAIYAQENGQGMAFTDNGDGGDGGDGNPSDAGPDKPKRPALKVVK